MGPSHHHHDNGVYQYIDQGTKNNVGGNFYGLSPFSSFNSGYPNNSHALFFAEPGNPNTIPQQDLLVGDDDATEKNEKLIGLQLTKTPSFLNSLDKFFTSHDNKKRPHSPHKLKAANFRALSIQIGHWKRESKHEGDLVAKCYFKKRILVWEALEGNLKIKLQFQWSDISAISAEFHATGPGILKIMLEKIPFFFREEEPIPRKHTNWKPCDDFTNRQASSTRIHTLEFAPGVLEKHYERIIQADPRLVNLSKQPFPYQASRFFKEIHFTNELNFNNPPMVHQHHFPSYFDMSQHQQPRALGMEVLNIQDHISNYPEHLVTNENYRVHDPMSNPNVALDHFVDQIQDQPGPSTNYDQHRMSQWEVAMSSLDVANHLVGYDPLVDLEPTISYGMSHNYDVNRQMNQTSMDIPYPDLSHDGLDQFSHGYQDHQDYYYGGS